MLEVKKMQRLLVCLLIIFAVTAFLFYTAGAEEADDDQVKLNQINQGVANENNQTLIYGSPQRVSSHYLPPIDKFAINADSQNLIRQSHQQIILATINKLTINADSQNLIRRIRQQLGLPAINKFTINVNSQKLIYQSHQQIGLPALNQFPIIDVNGRTVIYPDKSYRR
jgi:NADPH-dependent 7-cyano-7-deazaguanine reductase QueF-like protein